MTNTPAVAQWVRAFASQAEGWMFVSQLRQTIAGEGLQILTYAWHSWPLSMQ